MAEMSKGSRRTNTLLLVFGMAVWLFNAYKMATGLQTMGVLDGLSGGTCFLLGPFLLFEYYKAARGRRS